MKLNVQLFPTGDALSGLAEAYAKSGNKPAAIDYTRRLWRKMLTTSSSKQDCMSWRAAGRRESDVRRENCESILWKSGHWGSHEHCGNCVIRIPLHQHTRLAVLQTHASLERLASQPMT
jgi:hypothetical protein